MDNDKTKAAADKAPAKKKAAAKAPKPDDKIVTVRALTHLTEDENYKPGDKFEVTQRRCDSLGKLVQKVE